MKQFKHILLLAAIAFTASVSAKAPPGHGEVKESKSKACPSFVSYSYTAVEMIALHTTVLIQYVEPVRNWVYVDVAAPIYSAPYVAPVAAFFARNSC